MIVGVCVSVCLLTCRLFPGWLVVMSDWLPAGFITLHQRQKQTSVASHPRVSILLFLSLPPSFSHCLSRCPIEPGFEPSVGWRWFCLAGWAVGNHFDLSERQSSRCHLWSSCPAQESLMVDTHKHTHTHKVHKYMKITDSFSHTHTPTNTKAYKRQLWHKVTCVEPVFCLHMLKRKYFLLWASGQIHKNQPSCVLIVL